MRAEAALFRNSRDYRQARCGPHLLRILPWCLRAFVVLTVSLLARNRLKPVLLIPISNVHQSLIASSQRATIANFSLNIRAMLS
jgi:hypothetical protein